MLGVNRVLRLLGAVAFGIVASMAAPAVAGSLSMPAQAGSSVSLSVEDGIDLTRPGSVLQVFVGPGTACCTGRTPIAGRYEKGASVLRFTPVFAFIEDQIYTVRVDLGDGPSELTEFVVAPDVAAVEPAVAAIYPSGDALPENVLRFYIHFSRPMQPHRAAEFISLVGADGRRDDAAFMMFKQELWNEDRTQLTVLMDPGRIKRGVAQNMSLGPALIEGRSYTLVVDAGWPAANGGRLLPRYEKRFVVSAALRTLPSPEQWKISPPRGLTRDPLILLFDRPFDHHGLRSAIQIVDAQGQAVSGRIRIEDGQRRWRFDPDRAWSGAYADILVVPTLEDVAGNNFRDLLDHAIGTSAGADGPLVKRFDLIP